MNQQHLAFVAAHNMGTLATLKRDGRPQLSNVVYVADVTGLVRVSLTADRAKTRNADRDPRVSLHVSSDDFWAYVVAEGDAQLTPVASAPDDVTVDALVELYRAISGEHPDWNDYRAAMIREQRQVLSFSVTHTYGYLSG